jgi:hypothetical protein
MILMSNSLIVFRYDHENFTIITKSNSIFQCFPDHDISLIKLILNFTLIHFLNMHHQLCYFLEIKILDNPLHFRFISFNWLLCILLVHCGLNRSFIFLIHRYSLIWIWWLAVWNTNEVLFIFIKLESRNFNPLLLYSGLFLIIIRILHLTTFEFFLLF